MTIERLGSFKLTLTEGEHGLVRADNGYMVLELAADHGTYASRDGTGSERWQDGRVRGTWLDLPYGHECDVDEAISRDAWIARTLIEMRRSVLAIAAPEPTATPTAARTRWRKLWRYAVDHDLFSPNVYDSAAQACVAAYAATAKPRELAELVHFFDRRRLRTLLKAAEAATPAKLRTVFAAVAIPDEAQEQRALAKLATTYAKLHAALTEEAGDAIGPDTIETSEPACVSHANNLARALIDGGMTTQAAPLFAAIRAVVRARTPADELRWGQTPGTYACDEYYFRQHAATLAWAAKRYAAGLVDARRAVELEDLLDRKGVVSSSAGSWGLMSCLAETADHPEAAEFFAAILGDRERLQRRVKGNRSSLEAALVAGFYATFKTKPIDPAQVLPLFEAAISVVAKPTHPLLAHWYAFVCCALDRVDRAEHYVEAAVRLGLDAHDILAEAEWAPFVARHDLSTREPWRTWLAPHGSA